MRCIAYIPARAGSKGIPHKNIRPLCGKPLIAYAIEAAIESGRFERVFVSTDSEEIAEISRRHGAWVPFLRDPEFATDTATTVSAMCSDKARLEAMGETFDAICLLQTTSPQRTAADICGAMDVFASTGEGVVSVSPVNEHPILMRTISPAGRLEKVVPVAGAIRRQDMPKYYKLNGAIKGTERKLFDGSLVHGGQPLMSWCVGNAKTEPRGNAVIVTKAVSGAGKIDPLMATFNAVYLMSLNPAAAKRKSLAGMLARPVMVV